MDAGEYIEKVRNGEITCGVEEINARLEKMSKLSNELVRQLNGQNKDQTRLIGTGKYRYERQLDSVFPHRLAVHSDSFANEVAFLKKQFK